MASQHTTAPSAAARTRRLVDLDEDAQVEVLRAAKAARVLAALSSSSKQLCRLARSRLPVQLRITRPEHAELVIRSHVRRRPPWSACTALAVEVDSPSSGLGVLTAAQQWTALQQVDLTLKLTAQQLQQPSETLDAYSSTVLGALPGLKGLRHLGLHTPVVGVHTAWHLGRLVNLTRLELVCTAPAATPPPPAAPDLSALAGMTSLKELVLTTLSMQPSEGFTGPSSFPSSLTLLDISDPDSNHLSLAFIPMAIGHLQGCPALQEVRVYCQRQHPIAHPGVLVGLLWQHNRQLRRLVWATGDEDDDLADLLDLWYQQPSSWAGRERWRLDGCFAGLTCLEHLDAGHWLCLDFPDHWQDLAQLTALTSLRGVCFLCAPPPPPAAGVSLAVLDMGGCWVQLGGADMGRVLLACPGLRHASVSLLDAPAAADTDSDSDADVVDAGYAVTAGGEQLALHPSLRSFQLEVGDKWGPAAAAHMAALAPVLAGVSQLTVCDWPCSATSQPLGGLPDLSPCTALTRLVFGCKESAGGDQGMWPEQEDFLLMLAPLVQLRCLEVSRAPRLNARVALVLQTMLPKLRKLILKDCGSQLPLEAASAIQQGREEILGKVKELLRPGLQLVVV